MAVLIEIWYTQSLAGSIVLWTFTCERHYLELIDKIFISASKVDTPPNINSQTFLCRDTETLVPTNQPQWYKEQLLFFTPEDQVVAKKCKKDSSVIIIAVM